MKTKWNWVSMAFVLTLVLTLGGCKFIDDLIKQFGNSGSPSEDNHYFTEVGIRAENLRATCRKVCMDGLSNADSLIVLPTGDSIVGPLDSVSFDTCITICNQNTELSPEFISFERSHFLTGAALKQQVVAKLSNKFIILTYFPIFVWDLVIPMMVPSDPPISGGDCGMYSCLAHVHIKRTSTDDEYFRVITSIPAANVMVDMALENDDGSNFATIATEPGILADYYRQSKIQWSELCSLDAEMKSLQLRVTRYTTSGDEVENTTWTPIWFNEICLAPSGGGL